MKPIKLTEDTYTLTEAITIAGLGAYQKIDAINHILIAASELKFTIYVDTKQLNHIDVCSDIEEHHLDEHNFNLIGSGEFKEVDNLTLKLGSCQAYDNGIGVGYYMHNNSVYYPMDKTSIFFEYQYLSTNALFITRSAVKLLIGGKPTRSDQRTKEELFKKWLITNAQCQKLNPKLYYPKPDYNAIYQELFSQLNKPQVYFKLQQIYPTEFSQQHQYFFKNLNVNIKFPQGSTLLRNIK